MNSVSILINAIQAAAIYYKEKSIMGPSGKEPLANAFLKYATNFVNYSTINIVDICEILFKGSGMQIPKDAENIVHDVLKNITQYTEHMVSDPKQVSNIWKLIHAASFASDKHKKQYRKNVSKDPYFLHLIGVCKYASDAGITDINILCACLLHDVIEDTNTTAEELALYFSPNVVKYVMEVTDDKTLSKSERKIKQMVKSSSISDEAKIVKLADKLYNLSDLESSPPPEWSSEYIVGTVIWMKKMVQAMESNFTDTNLKMAFDSMKILFDERASSTLLKYNKDYKESGDEEILTNYCVNLC